MSAAAHHPFDFARVGARHGRQHLADLIADDRHVPAFWTAAHPPDSFGLVVEMTLSREMTGDEMAVYAEAFRDAYEAAVDEHGDEHGDGAEGNASRVFPAHPRHITAATRGAMESHP